MRALLDPESDRGGRRLAAPGAGLARDRQSARRRLQGRASSRSTRAIRTCSATSASPASRELPDDGGLPRGRGRRRDRLRRAGGRRRRTGFPPRWCCRRASARAASSTTARSASALSPTRAWRSAGRTASASSTSRSGAAMFSGVLPKAMAPGSVALVSQSGSLGNFAFSPLMRDRKLGFSSFHLVRQPDRHHHRGLCRLAGRRSRRHGDRLHRRGAEEARTSSMRAARRAHAQRKSLVFFQIGTSASAR